MAFETESGTRSSVSVQTFIEKNKLSSTTPFLFLLEIHVKNRNTGNVDSIIRVAKNSTDVYHRGDLYVGADFNFDFQSKEGEQSNVTLTVKDYRRSLQAIIQEYQGGVGSTVYLKVVNGDRLDEEPDVNEIFQINNATAQSYEINWTLGAMDLLSRRTPKRKQNRDRCCWRFKDKECGYTGSSNFCDLSLQGSSGCSYHNNEGNYGGFPGITIQQAS